MILALEQTKDFSGKACYYNSKEEREELLSWYKNQPYKVFTNDDKNNARTFANVNKITGFSLENMSTFQILMELKQNQVSAVDIWDMDHFKRLVILNKTYFLASNKYLRYNVMTDNFEKAEYSGAIANAVDNFCDQITRYAHIQRLNIKDACFEYLVKYEKMFKNIPTKSISSSTITQDKEDIILELTSRYIFEDDYNPMLREVSLNKVYNQNSIISIHEKFLALSFKDQDIIQGIQKFLQNF